MSCKEEIKQEYKSEKKSIKKEELKKEKLSAIELSKALLNNIKNKGNNSKIVTAYKTLNLDKLSKELDTDNKKLAFWVNTYNGFIQYILEKDPALFEDRNAFFKKEQANIGGEMISFDKIEHGIIRSSTMKLSLGYLPKLFPGELEKQLRVEDKDKRIYFILNCGAKDCPPIYIYNTHIG